MPGHGMDVNHPGTERGSAKASSSNGSDSALTIGVQRRAFTKLKTIFPSSDIALDIALKTKSGLLQVVYTRFGGIFK